VCPIYCFTQKDRLGSTTQILDENGDLLHTKSYDAFGKPRNGDWSDMGGLFQAKLDFNDANGTIDLTKRGFTDHEHLDEMQLIHMNGRMYDYNNGRFLSVDPFIQSPTSTQSMNPYTYIFNNPLSGVDPTGYKSHRRVDGNIGYGSVCAEGLGCSSGRSGAQGREPANFKSKPAVKNGKDSFGVNLNNGEDPSEIKDEKGRVIGIDFNKLVEEQQKEDSEISYSDIIKDALIGAYDQATSETSQEIAETIASAIDPREDYKNAIACFNGSGSCLGTALDLASRKLDKLIDVYKIIKKSGACCFVAGTKVLSKDGYKNIEDVELGELVWAKNIETGELDWKPVSKIYVEHDRGIYHIRLRKSDGNIINIEATDDHPFYVVNHGWKTTVELQVGDKVETKEVGSVVVVSVEDERREDTTYNFEIADFHTYYVTEFGVLVHNCLNVSQANRSIIEQLRNSSNASVTVNSKVDAEALLRQFTSGTGHKGGYMNTTSPGSFSPQASASDYLPRVSSRKSGTYHWDNYNPNAKAGDHASEGAHLQIHTFEGQVIRVFYND